MLLKQSLPALPDKPGVYQYLDSLGAILYIGKAKSLKKRVGNYFQKALDAKTMQLIHESAQLIFIETDSELEALMLETNLIKQHRPRFNILMRDDKNYVYIKVTTKDDFPKISVVRKILKDGNLYFGPKTSARHVYGLLETLRQALPYRTCTLSITETAPHEVVVTPKSQKIPCFDYHINLCNAPCIGNETKEEYRATIETIKTYLKGDTSLITRALSERMLHLSEAKKYEQAAHIRDTITRITQEGAEQKVTRTMQTDIDIIGYYQHVTGVYLNLFRCRTGKVVDQERFTLKPTLDATEILPNFFAQYYTSTQDFPEEVLIQDDLVDVDLFQDYLKSLSHKSIQIHRAARGEKHALLLLAIKNARSIAEQTVSQWSKDETEIQAGLMDLKELLSLPTIPNRIECYDISHLAGTNTVASMVVLEKGKATPSMYRKFQLKSLEVGEIDDFKSMKEVMKRRLKYLVVDSDIKEVTKDKADKSLLKRPDLLVIDGGKGQLSAAFSMLTEYKLDIPMVSIAKREEILYDQNHPEGIVLPHDSKVLYLITTARNEAHRFAITYQKKKREKGISSSQIEDIAGIGPATRRKLLKRFGSFEGIKQAPMEELTLMLGAAKAKKIRDSL